MGTDVPLGLGVRVCLFFTTLFAVSGLGSSKAGRQRFGLLPVRPRLLSAEIDRLRRPAEQETCEPIQEEEKDMSNSLIDSAECWLGWKATASSCGICC